MTGSGSTYGKGYGEILRTIHEEMQGINWALRHPLEVAKAEQIAIRDANEQKDREAAEVKKAQLAADRANDCNGCDAEPPETVVDWQYEYGRMQERYYAAAERATKAQRDRDAWRDKALSARLLATDRFNEISKLKGIIGRIHVEASSYDQAPRPGSYATEGDGSGHEGGM